MKRRRIIILGLAAAFLMADRQIAHPGDTNSSSGVLQSTALIAGRALFLKNCAHCHGADAHGDEGPDLHKLEVSDTWIANRIRNGKAGEMTAFAGKLQTSEIKALVAYLRSLNP